MTLDEIITLARAYARARETLETITEEIEGERRQAVRRRLRALKARVAETSAAKDALRTAIAEEPELFAKPRTRAIEGVKVGYRKMPGRIVIADEDRSIRRVRDKLPDREAELVRVKESLDRNRARQARRPHPRIARRGRRQGRRRDRDRHRAKRSRQAGGRPARRRRSGGGGMNAGAC